MGIDLGRWIRDRKRDIVDVFDANTERDQQKRLAAGQPRYYQQQQQQAPRNNSSSWQGVPYKMPQQQPDRRSFLSKVYDQYNIYDNGRDFNTANPVNSRSNLSEGRRNLNTIAAGIARSGGGIVNDISGFADLVTPGKGTNRVTQATRKFNEDVDKFVEKKGYSSGLYKSAQLGHNLAAFATPGAVAKAAGVGTKAPVVFKGAGNLSKVGNWAVRPDIALDVAVDAAQGAGFRTARDQGVSPATVAADIGVSYGTAGLLTGVGKAGKKIKNLIDPESAKKPTVQFKDSAFKEIDEPSKEPAYLRKDKSKTSKKELTDAEINYRKQRANERAFDDTAIGRQAKQVEADLRAKQAVKLAQADLVDEPTFIKRRTALSRAYDKEVAATEGMGELRRKQTIDEINARYEQANRDLEDARAETEKILAGLKDDPTQAPRPTRLTPEEQLNQGVAETPEQFKINAPESTPAGTDAPIVVSNGGRSNIPTTAKGDTVVTPTPEGASVVIPKRTTDQAVKDVARALGRDVGEANTNLGVVNQAINAATGGRYSNTRGLNPFRQVSDYAGDVIGEAGEEIITGKGSRALRGAEGFFGGTGRSAETKQIPRQFEGRLANIGDLVGNANKESSNLLDSIPDARRQLDLALRDEAYIKRVYGEGASKQSLDSLPPELRAVAEKYTNANKVVNDINLQTGVINEAQWKTGMKGQHIARKFEIPKGEKELIRDHARALFDQSAGVKRKDISKMEDELIALLDKDPIRAIEFRTEMSLRNLAFSEALDGFSARKLIQDTAPNKGFIELKGKRWGKHEGRFMERVAYEQLSGNRQFTSDMATSINNLIETYQRSGVGQLDRLQKAFKTTMNVGTSVGNLLSNPMVFNIGAGTNPVTQLYDMAGAFRQMRKGMSNGDVYLARELGVIGGDTGRILTGSSNRAASAVGDAKVGTTRKVLNKFGSIYGGIDDVAKLGLFNRLRKKGMAPKDAALEVAKFTQDYNNVGRTVQAIADMPVAGKPFARFSPELVRIIKNNVTRAPHRIIAGVAALAFINNKLSAATGETDEERRTREEAVGQTMIPGTAWINKQTGGPDRDISLNIPVGDSAVNIARTVGLNFPIEPGVDPNRALIEQLIPVEIPVRKNAIGETVFDPTKIVTSMTLRPFVEQAFDQNFMGKKISDPTNVTYDSQGNVQKLTPPSLKDQLINRGLAFGASVLPMGYEATSIGSSLLGRPGPTGKERSVGDSIARAFGIKAEKNDPETRAKRTDTSEFFEISKPAQDQFLKDNKDLEPLFFDIFPKTKDRNTGKKISDIISPEKWDKVNSDKSGRMFNFMKEQAFRDNRLDSDKPIDPIYRLPESRAKEVLALRSQPTGNDIEREQILRATTDWYKPLEKDERAYYKKLDAYFAKLKRQGVDIDSSQHDRVKKYNAIKYPEQPKLLQDYYAKKEKDPEGAKAYLKQFDSDWVSSQFDKDSDARFKYTNAKRAIEGVPPIDKKTWDNVTFGYEDDEDKVATELYFKNKGDGYGYGYGGRGGRGGKSGSDRALNPYEYAISLSTGKTSLKPQVSVKTPPKPKVAKKGGTTKPKVSIKKSLV